MGNMVDWKLRCGLYVPMGIEPERWVHAEAAVAETEGWQVVSLVRRWEELVELLSGGLVHIGIIPTWDHLPPDRIPRLVATDEFRPPPAPLQRRPVISWR